MRTIVALACLALAAPAFAQEAGDYAPEIAPHRALNVPPGIYADTAQRLADSFATPLRIVWADKLAADVQNGKPMAIVDVRSATEYASGHIPGAISIPLAALFLPDGLAKLPTDGTPIVLVCATGHMGSMALGGLAALGYDAYVLRFSMAAWTAVSKQKIWTATVDPNDPFTAPQTILGLGGATAK